MQNLKEFQTLASQILPPRLKQPKRLTWVVGNAVATAFQPLVARLNSVEGLAVNLVPLCSDYWGQEITVTGLLTGHDLLLGLPKQDLGEAILLPSLMLKHDSEYFLDDLTVSEVSQRLEIPIVVVESSEDLLQKIVKMSEKL